MSYLPLFGLKVPDKQAFFEEMNIFHQKTKNRTKDHICSENHLFIVIVKVEKPKSNRTVIAIKYNSDTHVI